MPKHIRRLLLLFAVLITLFIIVRQVLIPDSFGQFGHYRGLALEENKAHVARYVGTDICAECHWETMELKTADMQAEISCETCHGPGWKHIEEPEQGQLTIPEGREFCGTCHSRNPARSASLIAQVNLSDHNIETNCSECHNPHAPWN